MLCRLSLCIAELCAFNLHIKENSDITRTFFLAWIFCQDKRQFFATSYGHQDHCFLMAASNETDSYEEKGKNSCSSFAIVHKKGDLFSCNESQSLAHCVSVDLRMGKGIATVFKEKFKGLNELKEQGKDVGDVAVLKRGKRFIYYLITKPKYFHKPTYQSLEQSLIAMKSHCAKNDVKAVSMPRIGCGLDKLEWDKVETMLKDLFLDMDMTITVYSL